MGFSGAALAATAVSAAVSAYGSAKAGEAQAGAAQYQAGVAQLNQQIAKQNADWAIASGEVLAQEKGMATRATMGQTVAQQGAGGLAVGTGSQGRVVASELKLGQYDESLVRSNAVKQAYGYEVEAAKFGADATMNTMAASGYQQAGYLKAFGSLLGGAASVSSKWSSLSQAGAFSAGGGNSFGAQQPEDL